MEDKRTASNVEQLLTFFVRGDEYGVDILRVQEIREWTTPMPIPNTPAYIKGVINLRGDIVPIADLRERLGLPHAEPGTTSAVIVLRVMRGQHPRVMGIVVDAMSDVTNVSRDNIKTPPELAAALATLAGAVLTLLLAAAIFFGMSGLLVRAVLPGV